MRAVALVRKARGLVQLTHPLPSMMYVLAIIVFSMIASAANDRTPAPLDIALVAFGVACAEIATGALNDYCDRHLDAQSNRSKPIVRGLVSPWEALVLAIVATVLLFAAGFPLGLIPLTLLVVIEALGVLYDLYFKGTPVSALLFAMYFPLFPLLAWSVFGSWQPFLPWLIPLGALLGIAMNISNSLPDLDADIAMGVRGLPHLLGPRLGKLIAWGTPPLLLVVIWLLHLTGAVPAHGPGLLIGTVIGMLSVLLAVSLYIIRPTTGTLRLNFTIQAVGVVGMATGWLVAVAF